MMSSVIPARLTFQCGHAALVTLPRVKGETASQRNERVAAEKTAALVRQCDFCGPTVEIATPTMVHQANGNHVTAADVYAAEPVVASTAGAPEAEPVVATEPVVVAELEPHTNGTVKEPKPARRRRTSKVAPITAEPVSEERVVAEPVSEETVVAEPVSPEPINVEPVSEQPVTAEAVAAVEPVNAAEPVNAEPVVVEHVVTQKTAQQPANHVAKRPRARSQRLTVTPRRTSQVSAGRQFVVVYRVTEVLNATDIRDALRQTTALGASEVTSITRQY
jgi:hypothetical protein